MSRALGVIVAGGAGRRLALAGPKALAVLEGRTLIERAIDALSDVCDELVVSLSPLNPFALPAHARVVVAHDSPGTEGPLAGVVAGLAARPFDVALVLGVDFPLVSAAALRALIAMLGEESAVVPAPAGIPQPLCAAYANAALAPLARALANGDRALVPAVRALAPRMLSDAEIAALPGGARNLFNVNTPEDLAEAARKLRDGGGRSAA